MELLRSSPLYYLPAVVLTGIFFCHSCAGQANCDSINWSSSRPLTWKDFKGAPDTNSRVGALSYISFKYKLEREKKKIRLLTLTYFQPCISWVDSSSTASLSLGHEQTHFNIDELIRRSFVQELLSIPFEEKRLRRNIQHQYFLASLSRHLMHNSYDLDTDYHRNEMQQKLWNEKLLQLLKEKESCSFTLHEWHVDD
jgi:hypothetical protein